MKTPMESWADKPAAAKRANVRQANHAVARTEVGLYPTCEICGARIDMERLRASASATTCASCSRTPPSKKKRTR